MESTHNILSADTTKLLAFSDAGEAALYRALSPLLDGLDLILVDLEIHRQKQKRLCLFIDLKNPTEGQCVGVEDCVRATRALDAPLDEMPEIAQVFGDAPYELEVSSPGLDRPLKRLSDFVQFKGRIIRIGTFRPLSAEELENSDWAERNPRQKAFLGELKGLTADPYKVELDLSAALTPPKKKSKPKKDSPSPSTQLVRIPFELICTARLEPDFGDVFKNSNDTKARLK
jgi:ribosome maturation factor RimP